MGVSAAIIVKNEEAVMRRCIESVSLFADEIVITDTGSTDSTKQIASSFPKVKLFDSEHFNKDTHFSDFSFSVAKNEAIRKCTCDHVIWFDADDFMEPDSAARIKDAGNIKDKVVFSIPVESGPLRFEHTRMFPNGCGVLFDEGHSCHEYLETNGLPVERLTGVVIRHLPVKRSMSSSERNLAILEKDCFKRGRNDPRTLFYLANAYRELGRFGEAVKFYDLYLAVSRFVEERFFARYYKARSLASMNNLVAARNEILMSLVEDFRFAEPYCFLGDIAFTSGDFARAEAWFRMALCTPYPRDARLFVSECMYREYPEKRMEDCRQASRGKMDIKTVSNDREVLRFGLPSDKKRAALAACALSSLFRFGMSIEVSAEDEWQRELVSEMEGVKAFLGFAEPLDAPRNLGNRHVVEWCCRVAGVLPKSWGPMSMKRKTSPEKGRFLVCKGEAWSHDRWVELVEEIKKRGAMVDEMNEEDKVSAMVEKLAKAEACFCGEGWVQHLARSFGVPSLVLWNGGDPGLEGWPEQLNLRAESTSVSDAIAEFDGRP